MVPCVGHKASPERNGDFATTIGSRRWMMTLDRERGIILDVSDNSPVGFSRPWTITGYILLAGAAFFVGGIVYQETILTWTDGPQSLGFGNVHTGSFLFFFLVAFALLVGNSLWTIGSVVLLIRKKFQVPLVEWAPIVLLVILAAILAIPYESWEVLSVRIVDPGPHGNRFMLYASASGNQPLVAYLLRKGYDVNYELDGTTPLSGASVGGKKEMVRFLISKGADVNRKSRSIGETPLMAAAEMGKLETTNVLLDNGADPCATDNEGHTAAGLARKYGHGDISEYLSSRFACQEKVIDSCADPSVSVCVHP
jgi:hypothetical protein